jgi:hypothetical protein
MNDFEAVLGEMGPSIPTKDIKLFEKFSSNNGNI